MDHGLQHFCSSNNSLTKQAATVNELLLYGRNLDERNFYTQVASSNHDAICNFANFVDVVYTGTVLNLCDDANVCATVCVKEISESLSVCLCGNEGCCNEINVVLDTEKQVCLVCFAKVVVLQNLVREVHALAIRNFATCSNCAVNVIALNGVYNELNKSVTYHNYITGVEFLSKSLVCYRNASLIALYVVCCECELIALVKVNLVVSKGLNAVLGTFCVQHDGDWQVKFFSNSFN